MEANISPKYGQSFRGKNNIDRLVSEHTQPSPEEEKFERAELLKAVDSFTSKLVVSFKEEFSKLIEQYSKNKKPINPEIMKYLKDRDLLVPTFRTVEGGEAQEFLRRFNFYDPKDPKHTLLIFQLPKPLASFWWKGGVESGDPKAEDVGGSAIEWGDFYRELMPLVWKHVDSEAYDGAILFDRLNDIGDHDPQKFYYVWKISKKN